MKAIVSHDAGGAEIISSYLKQSGDLNMLYVLDGPAKKIFFDKLGITKICSINYAVKNCSELLCGTSWKSTLEFDAICLAKLYSKKAIAFLDHWINYQERFVRHNKICYPDEIWVGDKLAYETAKNSLPLIPIKLVDNYYFIQAKKFFSVAPQKNTIKEILYVCEPIREHAKFQFNDPFYFGYTEESALEFFLESISIIKSTQYNITIRPHPSELPEKYTWVREKFSLPIVFSERKLMSDIFFSDIVIGCQSMAMVIGVIANKMVISSIPPGGKKCMLPHHEILSLVELINNGKLYEKIFS